MIECQKKIQKCNGGIEMQGDLLNKFLENQEKTEKNKNAKEQENKEEISLIDVDLLDEFENHIFSAILP